MVKVNSNLLKTIKTNILMRRMNSIKKIKMRVKKIKTRISMKTRALKLKMKAYLNNNNKKMNPTKT